MKHIYNIIKVRARETAVLTAAVLAAAGCAGSDDGGGTTPPVPASADGAVMFTTSVDASADVTRGYTGPINDVKTLQENVTEGFGVLAYLTDDKRWGEAGANDTPDFMYNQPVTWDWLSTVMKEEGGVTVVDEDKSVKGWKYEPLKYWPNSSQNATPRYVSFFAYAPYVSSDNIAASPTEGIVGMTNGTDKSPYVEYRMGDVGSQVDLLWANALDQTRNGQGLIYTDGDGQQQYQRVKLEFHHALACVDIYVQRVYDETTFTGKKPDSKEYTKLFLSKLVLDTGTSSTTAFQNKGKLSLETGKWTDTGAIDATEVGDKDHYQLTYDESVLEDSISGVEVEKDDDKTALTKLRDSELAKWGKEGFGVDERARLLLTGGTSLLVLPQTVTLTPTLTYSMVTRDDRLEFNVLTDSDDADKHYYSRIVNEVTGSGVKLTFESGKRYKLLLHIGVESVELEVVSVEDWDFPMRFNPGVKEFAKDPAVEHTLDEDYKDE